jgi:hypothetical protein
VTDILKLGELLKLREQKQKNFMYTVFPRNLGFRELLKGIIRSSEREKKNSGLKKFENQRCFKTTIEVFRIEVFDAIHSDNRDILKNLHLLISYKFPQL